MLVLDAIETINRELKTTTAVITHNADIAKMADRVIYLSDGKVAEEKINSEKLPASQLRW